MVELAGDPGTAQIVGSHWIKVRGWTTGRVQVGTMGKITVGEIITKKGSPLPSTTSW